MEYGRARRGAAAAEPDRRPAGAGAGQFLRDLPADDRGGGDRRAARAYDEKTALGAWLWLGGRVAYLPLYALGVPVCAPGLGRQLVGIVMVLEPALAALL